MLELRATRNGGSSPQLAAVELMRSPVWPSAVAAPWGQPRCRPRLPRCDRRRRSTNSGDNAISIDQVDVLDHLQRVSGCRPAIGLSACALRAAPTWRHWSRPRGDDRGDHGPPSRAI
jgi:hypothetical protein